MSDLFDEYEILSSSTSHEGGYATVYKVKHKKLGYIRAIRVLKDTIINEKDPKYLKFLEECKLLLRLGNGSHPNIVYVAQPKLLRGKALVEMEYITGEDLNDYLKSKNGFISIEEVEKFVYDISNALSYCHHDIYKFCLNMNEDNLNYDDNGKIFIDHNIEEQLVDKYKVKHNDIHSKNIIRKYDGSFILLDFGLAIQKNTLVRSSTRKGGVDEYKAPEKWEDDGIITEKTDIYSFGILMYEVLTGKVPFELKNKNSFTEQNKLRIQHSTDAPPPIEPFRKAAFEKANPGKNWVKDYPDWLESAIFKCLEKSPADRFQNGKELFEFVAKNIKNEKLDKTQFKALSSRLQESILEIDNKNQEIENHKTKILDLTKKLSSEAQQIQEIRNLKTKINQIEKEKNDAENKTKILENEIDHLGKKSNTSDLNKNNKFTAKTAILFMTAFLLGLLVKPIHDSYKNTNTGGEALEEVANDPAEPVMEDEITEEFYVTDRTFTFGGETYKYTGEIKDGVPNGQGTATIIQSVEKNTSYEGRFENGLKDGTGKLINKDVDNAGTFIGTFTKNLKTEGKYIWADGEYFIGSYRDNEIFTGTFYDSNGNKQADYKEGKQI